MTLGTKTLLFGVHQVIWHPLFVLIAWVRLYRSFPSWRELICIVIHDWGYWGRPELKNANGDRHPEYGAMLAERWLGPEWRDFILGHSSFYIERYGVKRSKLLAPDKYWHCMIPLWLYKCMAVPTGEFKHYREVKHARQVSKLDNEPDWVWWKRLQIVQFEKVNGDYKIDKDNIDV